MSQVKILIIELDPSAAAALKVILERLGYRVGGIAFSDQEAIHLIEQVKPGIVLMNILLRGRNNSIHTGSLINHTYDVPVLYIIDQSGQATISRAAISNPFGYIFKPYDEKRIYATIETALLRYQLEKKLQQNMRWFDTTLTNIGDGVIATDENGIVRFINPVAAQLSGWQEHEAIGKPLNEVFSLRIESTNELANLQNGQSGNTSAENRKEFEGLLQTKDEKELPVKGNLTTIKEDTGTMYRIVLVFRDITQQRETMLEIKKHVQRAETLLDVASQINAEVELEAVLKKVSMATSQALKCLGTMVLLKNPKRDVFRVMAIYIDNHPVDDYAVTGLEFPVTMLEEPLNYENSVAFIPDIQSIKEIAELEIVRSLNIRTTAIAQITRHGEVTGLLVAACLEKLKAMPIDQINLLKGLANQASTAIANAAYFDQILASREEQQIITRKLVKVQEDERRSLSRELHDEIGQMLTGLQFSIKSVMATASEDQMTGLNQVQSLIGEIISQIRELSINLRPGLLDDLGILPTLSWHFDRYTAKTGIRVNFENGNLDRRFPPDIEITAFRIVQEALTNVARYAESDHVDVKVAFIDPIMQVEISDQGKGFDISLLSKNQAMGLEGMRERAIAIGGLLEIQSTPGGGTRIRAMLPISGKLERRGHGRNRNPG